MLFHPFVDMRGPEHGRGAQSSDPIGRWEGYMPSTEQSSVHRCLRRFSTVALLLCLLVISLGQWLDRVVLPSRSTAWKASSLLRPFLGQSPVGVHVLGLGDLLSSKEGPQLVVELDWASLWQDRLLVNRLSVRRLRLQGNPNCLSPERRRRWAQLLLALRRRVRRMEFEGLFLSCKASDPVLPFRTSLCRSDEGWTGVVVAAPFGTGSLSLKDLLRPRLDLRFQTRLEPETPATPLHLVWHLGFEESWSLSGATETASLELRGHELALPLKGSFRLSKSRRCPVDLKGRLRIESLFPPSVRVDASTITRSPRRLAARLTRSGETWKLEDFWLLSGEGLIRGAGLWDPRHGSSLALELKNLPLEDLRSQLPETLALPLRQGRLWGRLELHGNLEARRIDHGRFEGRIREGRLDDGTPFHLALAVHGSPRSLTIPSLDVESPRLAFPLRLRSLSIENRQIRGRCLLTDASSLPSTLRGLFPQREALFDLAPCKDGRWQLRLRNGGAPHESELLTATLRLPGAGRAMDIEGRASLPWNLLHRGTAPLRLPEGGRLDLTFRGRLPREGAELDLKLRNLQLALASHELVTEEGLHLEIRKKLFRLLPTRIALDGRPLRLSASWSPLRGLSAHLAFHGLTLPLPADPRLRAWEGNAEASGWAKIRGSLDDPTVQVGLSLCAAGRQEGTSPLLLSGKLALGKGRLGLKEGKLSLGRQRARISLDVPAHLGLHPLAFDLDHRKLSLEIASEDLELATLTPHLLPLRGSASGKATLDMVCKPYASPVEARGRIRVRDFRAEGGGLPQPVKAGTLDLRLQGNEASIEACHFESGGLLVNLSGALRPSADGELSFDLRIGGKAERLQVADLRLEGFSGQTRLSGTVREALLSGTLRANDVLITPPPTLQYHRSRLVQARDRFLPHPGLRLDLDLACARPIRVQSRWVDAEFTGGLQLSGKRDDLELLGELSLVRGSAHVQSRRFAIDSGSVRFTRTPPRDLLENAEEGFTILPTPREQRDSGWPLPLPQVQLRGQTRVATRSISFVARGCPGVPQAFGVRFDAPGSDWTSTEILSLLTVGRATTELADGELGRLVALPYSQALTDTLLNNHLGHWITRKLALDEVRLSAGQDLTNPVPHVSLGKRLSTNLFFSADGSTGTGSFFKNYRADWQVSSRLEASFSRSLDGSGPDGELLGSVDLTPIREDQALLRYTMRF